MFLNPDIVNVRNSKVLFLFLGGKLHVSFMHGADFYPYLKYLPNCSCRQWMLLLKGQCREYFLCDFMS
jgi:hypothetical protein